MMEKLIEGSICIFKKVYEVNLHFFKIQDLKCTWFIVQRSKISFFPNSNNEKNS